MEKILKFDELKDYNLYSESYKILFWLKDANNNNFWKHMEETYFSKSKDDYENVIKKWEKDYKGSKVEFINIRYL